MKRAISWMRGRLSDRQFLLLTAVVTGLLTGAGAFVLKTLIGTITSILTGHLHLTGGNWLLLVVPIAGIVLTGIYCRYILKDKISHGTKHLMADIKASNPVLKPHLTYAPVLASSITIGFGGSAGSEGPIAYTGAAIGSNIGRVFGLTPQMLMVMVGCGAGAGIAGIFKAPIGGMLFTLEVLGMELTTMSVMALMVACVVSAMTATALSGFTIDMVYSDPAPFEPSMLWWAVIIGLFCGLYSFYYSYMMRRADVWVTKLKNPWVRNLAAGAVLSVLIFLFPTLYGEGYDSVAKILNHADASIVDGSVLYHLGISHEWVLPVVLAGILAVKSVATSVTNSGGGVGGDFAPTLFAGSMAGFLFGLLANQIPGVELSVGTCAYIGMAGVMAGAVQAPLMAIFLTVEMAGVYSLFMPLLIVAVVSYTTVRLLSPSRLSLRRAIFHYNPKRES